MCWSTSAYMTQHQPHSLTDPLEWQWVVAPSISDDHQPCPTPGQRSPLSNSICVVQEWWGRPHERLQCAGWRPDPTFTVRLSVTCAGTSSASWRTSPKTAMCRLRIRLHRLSYQLTSPIHEHQCLHLPTEVVSALQHMAILLQNKEIWTTMFHCFWSHIVQHTAVDRVWPITDTDSVLCALEDHAILQNLWNTAIAHQWQFSL